MVTTDKAISQCIAFRRLGLQAHLCNWHDKVTVTGKCASLGIPFHETLCCMYMFSYLRRGPEATLDQRSRIVKRAIRNNLEVTDDQAIAFIGYLDNHWLSPDWRNFLCDNPKMDATNAIAEAKQRAIEVLFRRRTCKTVTELVASISGMLPSGELHRGNNLLLLNEIIAAQRAGEDEQIEHITHKVFKSKLDGLYLTLSKSVFPNEQFPGIFSVNKYPKESVRHYKKKSKTEKKKNAGNDSPWWEFDATEAPSLKPIFAALKRDVVPRGCRTRRNAWVVKTQESGNALCTCPIYLRFGSVNGPCKHGWAVYFYGVSRALLLEMFAAMVRNRERGKPKSQKIRGLYTAKTDEELFQRFTEWRNNGSDGGPRVEVVTDIFRPPHLKGPSKLRGGATQGKRAKPRKTMKGHRARMKRAKSKLKRQVENKGKKRRK